MQVLTPRVDLAGFLARIADAPARVLMLDYDGTLAPFRVRPDEAVPWPEVAEALRAIVEAGGTRVVIVSGRPAHELSPLLNLAELPEIWGSHGWERLLPDGTRTVEQPSPEVQRTLATAAAALTDQLPADARLERKLASIAVHWRGAPKQSADAVEQRAKALFESLAREQAVEVLPFDCGIELRAVGCNKQYAVKAVLAQTPDSSSVAYLGDDITDEDAFRAVKARGLGVLVRGDFRPTEADVWLRPPEDLVTFLNYWCIARRGDARSQQ